MSNRERGWSVGHSSSYSATSNNNSNNWREVVDAPSGRSYYYNVITKKTQWTKPDEGFQPASSASVLSSALFVNFFATATGIGFYPQPAGIFVVRV